MSLDDQREPGFSRPLWIASGHSPRKHRYDHFRSFRFSPMGAPIRAQPFGQTSHLRAEISTCPQMPLVRGELILNRRTQNSSIRPPFPTDKGC